MALLVEAPGAQCGTILEPGEASFATAALEQTLCLLHTRATLPVTQVVCPVAARAFTLALHLEVVPLVTVLAKRMSVVCWLVTTIGSTLVDSSRQRPGHTPGTLEILVQVT
jgi:hypothetical protein